MIIIQSHEYRILRFHAQNQGSLNYLKISMLQLSYSFSAVWDSLVCQNGCYTLAVNSKGVHSVERISYIYVHCMRGANYEHNDEQHFTR
jgi:hypothetical protein